jgi:catechol 2,3-dioxygenase-like lactoylglutathione lyase family enzyme
MVAPCLHHVLVATRDLDRSRHFYRDVLELREIARPAFSFAGAWFQFGGGQHLHLVVHEDATTRANQVLDTKDIHFALGMTSYRKTVLWLQSKGYRDDLPDGDLQKMVLRPDSIVGRPQIYIMDPDYNIIEFICDALD